MQAEATPQVDFAIWLAQQWSGLLTSGLIALCWYLVRGYFKHLDTCIDSLRNEMRVRISALDRLEEWREHKNQEDSRWREEWRDHLRRLDSASEIDQKRRHDLDGKMQVPIIKVPVLEARLNALEKIVEHLERSEQRT